MNDEFFTYGSGEKPDDMPAEAMSKLEAACEIWRALLPVINEKTDADFTVVASIINGHVSCSLHGLCSQNDVDNMANFLPLLADRIKAGQVGIDMGKPN